jgi:hypothetical protein
VATDDEELEFKNKHEELYRERVGVVHGDDDAEVVVKTAIHRAEVEGPSAAALRATGWDDPALVKDKTADTQNVITGGEALHRDSPPQENGTPKESRTRHLGSESCDG